MPCFGGEIVDSNSKVYGTRWLNVGDGADMVHDVIESCSRAAVDFNGRVFVFQDQFDIFEA